MTMHNYNLILQIKTYIVTFYVWLYETEFRCKKYNKLRTRKFLDLNIKVIGSDHHTSVYDKRNYFGFPIVNFPWLSEVPRLPSYGIHISQLVKFATCCSNVLDFNFKNLQITSKPLTQSYRHHNLRKNI